MESAQDRAAVKGPLGNEIFLFHPFFIHGLSSWVRLTYDPVCQSDWYHLPGKSVKGEKSGLVLASGLRYGDGHGSTFQLSGSGEDLNIPGWQKKNDARDLFCPPVLGYGDNHGRSWIFIPDGAGAAGQAWRYPGATRGLSREQLSGVVDRVTYHNPENGWSVLQVLPFDSPGQAGNLCWWHQTRVFAGATMHFEGVLADASQIWAPVLRDPGGRAESLHPPGALEKYIGSGLYQRSGAQNREKKLSDISRTRPWRCLKTRFTALWKCRGLPKKKLEMISPQHGPSTRAIRDVMMFLAVPWDFHAVFGADIQSLWR